MTDNQTTRPTRHNWARCRQCEGWGSKAYFGELVGCRVCSGGGMLTGDALELARFRHEAASVQA